VYHKPGEQGREYNARVAMRGALTGILAAIVAAIVAAAFASAAPFNPLAPIESVILVFTSGLMLVAMAIAAATAMMAYAVPTRAKAWGGQYAIVKRL
jgi:hypothetical protein